MKLRTLFSVIVSLAFMIPISLAAGDVEIYHYLHVQSPTTSQVRTIQSFGIEIEIFLSIYHVC